jgi:hypothetical protein
VRGRHASEDDVGLEESRRIRHLQEAPASVRFLSIEPLLEDLGSLDLAGIDWVIVGGESGSGARPMQPGWVRSIRSHCRRAGVGGPTTTCRHGRPPCRLDAGDRSGASDESGMEANASVFGAHAGESRLAGVVRQDGAATIS